MKRKIATAFAAMLLMLTACFAPVTQGSVPGCGNIYVTMGGEMEDIIYMYIQTYANNCRVPYGGLAAPMLAPFVTRLPYLSPGQIMEDICFAAPVDIDGDTVPDIIPISTQMTPIVHYIKVGAPARPPPGSWWRFTIFAAAAGQGVIFINPAFPCDVDCYTFNNDTGVYWLDPSPLAGKKAAESGGHASNVTAGEFVPSFPSRFPSGGLDTVPGTALFETLAFGSTTDGFGDGILDPVGSSIVMIPMMLLGEEYNVTSGGWDPTIAAPMPMVLTTGTAYDMIINPVGSPYNLTCPGESLLTYLSASEVGMPWEFINGTTIDWTHPKAFVKVTYAAVWSNMLYALNPDDDGDGIPDPEDITGRYYTVDSFWRFKERKVRQDVAIADITGDQKVTINDIVIGALAFGAQDEGLGLDGLPWTADDKPAADANYDARADFTGDGIITIVDLVRMAVDFGKTIDP